MLPGCVFSFSLIVATSIWFPLSRLRRKVIRAKGNLSLQILEYSTPRPKFKTQILISNFVGAKFSRWHLGITSFWRQLRSSLGLEIPGDSSHGFLFAFTCWGLLCFSFCGELHEFWNGEMVKWWNESFPIGVLLCFSFLGELNAEWYYPFQPYSTVTSL